MNKIIAVIMTLALLLCGLTAVAEGLEINCAIEDGGYVIRIPDESGDLGWLADDPEQDDSVLRLASEELVGDEYVVRYEPVQDGDMTVAVRHYLGIACDELFTWDLRVQDGAVTECLGGSHAASPDPAESDPYLIGEWETPDGMAAMTIEKNPGGSAWDAEIAGAEPHGAYVFMTTVYYDCDRNGFVYDKGKLWQVPVTDGEDVELGEADVYGATGIFVFTGDDQDLWLTWIDDETPDQEMAFRKAA